MSPEMRDMQCVVCEDFFTVEEISKNNGMCFTCFKALEEQLEHEERGSSKEEDLSDPELRGALQRYRKRKAYMKRYNERPDVQAKRKQYMKERNQRDRDIIRKAKELGVLPDETNS